MASERRLRIKTLVMVLAMVVCANVGDLMLKRGMTQIGVVKVSPSALGHAFWLTVTNPTIWIGICFGEAVDWCAADLRGSAAGRANETEHYNRD